MRWYSPVLRCMPPYIESTSYWLVTWFADLARPHTATDATRSKRASVYDGHASGISLPPKACKCLYWWGIIKWYNFEIAQFVTGFFTAIFAKIRFFCHYLPMETHRNNINNWSQSWSNYIYIHWEIMAKKRNFAKIAVGPLTNCAIIPHLNTLKLNFNRYVFPPRGQVYTMPR